MSASRGFWQPKETLIIESQMLHIREVQRQTNFPFVLASRDLKRKPKSGSDRWVLVAIPERENTNQTMWSSPMVFTPQTCEDHLLHLQTTHLFSNLTVGPRATPLPCCSSFPWQNFHVHIPIPIARWNGAVFVSLESKPRCSVPLPAYDASYIRRKHEQ